MVPPARPGAHVIFVGIDDTDTLDTPGTNQLARRIAAGLPPGMQCDLALRHQLFFDPRVPYTSHNGSASLRIVGRVDRAQLVSYLQDQLRSWFVPGSDPGLCVAADVPAPVSRFGRACQHSVVSQRDAWTLAQAHGLHLEGFGGTNDGVIGALAAVGLLAEGEDGRVIHRAGWSWPDEFSGVHTVPEILGRGVDEVRVESTGEALIAGLVDIGRHLRPNIREGRVVLLVAPAVDHPGSPDWVALKLK